MHYGRDPEAIARDAIKPFAGDRQFRGGNVTSALMQGIYTQYCLPDDIDIILRPPIARASPVALMVTNQSQKHNAGNGYATVVR